LYKKIFEYEELFNVRIAIIAQEKSSGDYEIFQPVPTENWPPAMKDIVRNLKSRSLELIDHDRTLRSYIPASPQASASRQTREDREAASTADGAKAPQVSEPQDRGSRYGEIGRDRGPTYLD
jgi:hypothetical protein